MAIGGWATVRLTCAGVLALAASVALAQDTDSLRKANLDADAAREEVRVVDEHPNAPVSDVERYRIRISDTCPRGRSVDAAVSDLGTRVRELRIERADTRRGKEVFFVLDASGRGGWKDSRLVAWRPGGSTCRRPRALFRFPPAGGKPKPPRGGDFLADWHVRLKDFAPRLRGQEVQLEEWYTDEDDSLSSPSILRRSFYRYNKRRDRHVRYHKVVKRNQSY